LEQPLLTTPASRQQVHSEKPGLECTGRYAIAADQAFARTKITVICGFRKKPLFFHGFLRFFALGIKQNRSTTPYILV
jgi:hypothetical protein